MPKPNQEFIVLWGLFFCVYVISWCCLGFIAGFDILGDIWRGVEIRPYFMALFGITLFIHGFIRAVKNNPLQNVDYRNWLRSTPWTADKPLPTGSLYPSWKDAIPLLSIIGMAHVHHIPYPDAYVPVMIAGYCLPYLILFNQQKYPLPFCCTLFGLLFLASIPSLWSRSILLIIFPSIVLLITLYHVKLCSQELPYRMQFLLDTPWKFISTQQQGAEVQTVQFGQTGSITDLTHGVNQRRIHLGFPLCALSPSQDEKLLPPLACFLLSITAGWIMTFISIVVESERGKLWGAPYAFIGLCILFRVMLYMNSTRMPLRLIARIATGNIIIPRYDRMFIAPITAALLITCLPTTLSVVGISMPIAYGISTGIAFYMLLALGPSVNNHRLTSDCRIVDQGQKGMYVE